MLLHYYGWHRAAHGYAVTLLEKDAAAIGPRPSWAIADQTGTIIGLFPTARQAQEYAERANRTIENR